MAVAGRETAVSKANRRARGPRRERSEWRGEGYPPEGTRPRSGLGRVARSRSDASRIGTGIGDTEAREASFVGRCWRPSYRRNGKSCVIDWVRRKAAQPPRRAAPTATRAGKPGGGWTPCRNEAVRHLIGERKAAFANANALGVVRNGTGPHRAMTVRPVEATRRIRPRTS